MLGCIKKGGTLENKTTKRAKHLPLILPGSCDRIRFCIEFGELEPQVLKNLHRQIWQRITKGRASADEYDLFQRIDGELSRFYKVKKINGVYHERF